MSGAKAFMSQRMATRSEGWPSRAMEEARQILDVAEPPQNHDVCGTAGEWSGSEYSDDAWQCDSCGSVIPVEFILAEALAAFVGGN